MAELAAPFRMSQPAVSRHLKVLEQAGLISRHRRATARLSHLEAEPLREATVWLADYREYWTESYERLDELVARLLAESVKDEETIPQTRPQARQEQEEELTMATTTIDVPEGLPFVDITREFNAPRDLIHRAYTDPELVPQWLGPRNLTMTSRSGTSATAARGATSRPIPTARTGASTACSTARRRRTR